MSPAFVALTALEITVGGGGAALTLGQLVGVHRQTHGTPCQTPFETGLFEDVGQAFFFRLRTHKAETIRDGGLLEYYPVEGNEFTLGGFDRLTRIPLTG